MRLPKFKHTRDVMDWMIGMRLIHKDTETTETLDPRTEDLGFLTRGNTCACNLVDRNGERDSHWMLVSSKAFSEIK